jgi:hypothetical protein
MAKKKDLFKLLTSSTLNTIRGKALVGAATPDDILSVFGHLDVLEQKLDDADNNDTFGTEGWRHHFGHPDAD